MESSESAHVTVLRNGGDVDGLIAVLQAQTPLKNVRGEAAHALWDVGDARAVMPLIAALQDPDDSHLRVNAAKALGKIGDARAVMPLIAALQDPHDGVRSVAAETLGRMPDTRAVMPLIAMLQDAEDRELRKNAAFALREIADARAVKPLIAALQDPHDGVRSMAAEALGRIGDRQAISPLIHAMQDTDGTVRYNAIDALQELKAVEAVEPLLAALKDKDESVCSHAITALGELGDGRAVDAIISSIRWDTVLSGNQATAAVALAKLGDKKAVTPVLVALEHWGGDHSRLGYLIHALGILGDGRAVKPLMAILKGPAGGDPGNAQVAEALGNIGDSQAVDLLIRGLINEHYDDNLKRVCARALGQIGDARAVEPLSEALKDNNEEVRAAAAEALERFAERRTVETTVSPPAIKPEAKKQPASLLGTFQDLLEQARTHERAGDLNAALATYRRAQAFVGENQDEDPALQLAGQMLDLHIERTEQLLSGLWSVPEPVNALQPDEVVEPAIPEAAVETPVEEKTELSLPVEEEELPVLHRPSVQPPVEEPKAANAPVARFVGIITCPNCEMRVIIKPDGTCPSCHRSISASQSRKVPAEENGELPASPVSIDEPDETLPPSSRRDTTPVIAEPASEPLKCPLCAEKIPADARFCPFCGAEFVITAKGYCSSCHTIVELEDSGNCPECGGRTIDQQIRRTLGAQPAENSQPQPVREGHTPDSEPADPHLGACATILCHSKPFNKTGNFFMKAMTVVMLASMIIGVWGSFQRGNDVRFLLPLVLCLMIFLLVGNRAETVLTNYGLLTIRGFGPGKREYFDLQDIESLASHSAGKGGHLSITTRDGRLHKVRVYSDPMEFQIQFRRLTKPSEPGRKASRPAAARPAADESVPEAGTRPPTGRWPESMSRVTDWFNRNEDQPIKVDVISIDDGRESPFTSAHGKFRSIQEHPTQKGCYRIEFDSHLQVGSDFDRIALGYEVSGVSSVGPRLVIVKGSNQRIEITAGVEPPVPAPPRAPLEVTWPEVPGYALQECNSCMGSGVHPVRDNHEASCQQCEGKGGYLVKEPAETCRACNGKGYRPVRDIYSETCEKCDGTGWLGVLKYSQALAEAPSAASLQEKPVQKPEPAPEKPGPQECPKCSGDLSERSGSPVSPYINTYTCSGCGWVGFRCGEAGCDGYLKPQEAGYPSSVRYNCVKCGWTGIGPRVRS